MNYIASVDLDLDVLDDIWAIAIDMVNTEDTKENRQLLVDKVASAFDLVGDAVTGNRLREARYDLDRVIQILEEISGVQQ